TYGTSRSSGPGGQNVNKVSSKVELRFNYLDSAFFSEEEKQCIGVKLSNRINAAHEIVLTCQSDRSQLKNKERVLLKLYDLLGKALAPVKPRHKTKPTRSSVEKRLNTKHLRAEVKSGRKGVDLG
ncbi:MAG: aminoacyl-tRNA hydrolase, partial [Marinilabiliales bacterium]|nr:aminoacyl-tRNA hydrolase [Marinilabiliales bacterium]